MLYELKKIRLNSGLSRKEAAEKLGVPFNTYRNWEQCVNMPRDNKVIKSVADFFNVSMEALFGYDMINPGGLSELPEQKNSPFTYVPLLGKIAAGEPIEMDSDNNHFPIPTEISQKHPSAFLLKVEGGSMNKILPDGCYALVDPCDEVDRDNMPYAVCVNGHDATIKRVHKLANGFELVPDSTDPTYKPKVYDYGEPGTETITIIGRVVYHVLPFDWSY